MRTIVFISAVAGPVGSRKGSAAVSSAGVLSSGNFTISELGVAESACAGVLWVDEIKKMEAVPIRTTAVPVATRALIQVRGDLRGS
jgi:hypothetical protein